MNSLAQFSVVAGLSLAAAGATWLVNGPPEETVFTCDSSLLKPDEICLQDVPENALWVDARSRGEWEAKSPPGSILWNLDAREDANAFEAEGAMAVMQAQIVVVYCGSEACGTSRQIADRIRALDLGPEVKVLYGGWDALGPSLRDSSSKP